MNLRLIMPVIAHRDAIDAKVIDKLIVNFLSNAKATRSVFSIADHNIRLKTLTSQGQKLAQTAATRFTNDVAYGENFNGHFAKSAYLLSRSTMTFTWPGKVISFRRRWAISLAMSITSIFS